MKVFNHSFSCDIRMNDECSSNYLMVSFLFENFNYVAFRCYVKMVYKFYFNDKFHIFCCRIPVLLMKLHFPNKNVIEKNILIFKLQPMIYFIQADILYAFKYLQGSEVRLSEKVILM